MKQIKDFSLNRFLLLILLLIVLTWAFTVDLDCLCSGCHHSDDSEALCHMEKSFLISASFSIPAPVHVTAMLLSLDEIRGNSGVIIHPLPGMEETPQLAFIKTAFSLRAPPPPAL